MNDDKTMQFGKITTHTSYFNGEVKSTKKQYEETLLIQDKAQALAEVMKAIDLISARTTDHLIIQIDANPRTHLFKKLTKTYTVDD